MYARPSRIYSKETQTFLFFSYFTFVQSRLCKLNENYFRTEKRMRMLLKILLKFFVSTAIAVDCPISCFAWCFDCCSQVQIVNWWLNQQVFAFYRWNRLCFRRWLATCLLVIHTCCDFIHDTSYRTAFRLNFERMSNYIIIRYYQQQQEHIFI